MHRNKWLDGLLFVQSSYCTHVYPPHFHDHYVISLITKGLNEGHCQKRKYQIPQNEIIVINPGEIHTGSSFENKLLSYIGFYIDPSFFGIQQPDFQELHINDPRLTKNFFTFFESRFSDHALEIEEKKVLFFQRLIHPEGTRATKNFEKKQVSRIKSFLQDHFDADFRLHDLSRAMGLSGFHLIRLFKESVGLTPFEYLRNLRIEKSKLLLRKSIPISEIAVQVGFYDQSHYHKHFKRIVGITPGHFQSIQQ
jgi:AraC-like DNA-binding protein